MLCPYQLNGSCEAHTVAVVSPVSAGFTTTVSVRILSQPVVFEMRFLVYVLACLMLCPYQLNGSCEAHTVAVVSPVSAGFTTTVSVSTESQPLLDVRLVVN